MNFIWVKGGLKPVWLKSDLRSAPTIRCRCSSTSNCQSGSNLDLILSFKKSDLSETTKMPTDKRLVYSKELLSQTFFNTCRGLRKFNLIHVHVYRFKTLIFFLTPPLVPDFEYYIWYIQYWIVSYYHYILIISINLISIQKKGYNIFFLKERQFVIEAHTS